mmetsp:Transcript_1638/g.1791  ORF Transcript_1638/g.1791 Transcript_1638/m.1791 type:complete len:98 (-) Transcript_1638:432-725(-)
MWAKEFHSKAAGNYDKTLTVLQIGITTNCLWCPIRRCDFILPSVKDERLTPKQKKLANTYREEIPLHWKCDVKFGDDTALTLFVAYSTIPSEEMLVE